MTSRVHRLLVAAAHKSSGKTTLSVGLVASLAARGLAVQPFKKGPDYIDPMWLTRAAGRDCLNLDPHLMSAAALDHCFARGSQGAQLALVEGNHGLFDGLSLDGRDSNAALARRLDAPVLLVIDVRGMTRGIAPLLLGYQAFDPGLRMGGVILNRVGGARHESKLRAVIEHYTDIPVLGAVAEDPRLGVMERHLGLMPCAEVDDADARVREIAEVVGSQLDLSAILDLAAAVAASDAAVGRGEKTNTADKKGSGLAPAVALVAAGAGVGVAAGVAAEVDSGSGHAGPRTVVEAGHRGGRGGPSLRIGIARDRAFGFYYADDLQALQDAGAELVFFDTLADTRLPVVDGLFIGGGFPESCMHAIEANAGLRRELRTAIEGGLPTYAECGGLMLLARSLSWRGQRCEMVGVIPGDAVMHERPVGRGYVQLEGTAQMPWPALRGATIQAHEFHHSSLEHLDPGLHYAWRVKRGHGIDGERDGLVLHRLLASYTHLRSAAGTDWATHFVAWVRHETCNPGRQAATIREPIHDAETSTSSPSSCST